MITVFWDTGGVGQRLDSQFGRVHQNPPKTEKALLA